MTHTAGLSPTAVDKALCVLRCVRELGDDATFTSIVKHSGLAKATAHRVIAALVRHGEVWRDAFGCYHVVYGPNEDTRATLVLRAMPHLLRLYAVTRQPSSLALLAGSDVLYLTTLCDDAGLALVGGTGRRVPAHRTVAGRLLLAFDDRAARHAYSRPELTDADRRTLRTQAALARREHVLVGRPAHTEGIVAAAALIPRVARFPLVAVVVGGPVGEVVPGSLCRVVLSTALGVGRALSRV
ncbi:helix-turn-helix domain-containing protein [Streptomyces californicus]|uniref:helix-turn-helix domain-containing protein n=1 Tax=Streptomyces californicus TaxID=67351 RepID=UPI0037991A00